MHACCSRITVCQTKTSTDCPLRSSLPRTRPCLPCESPLFRAAQVTVHSGHVTVWIWPSLPLLGSLQSLLSAVGWESSFKWSTTCALAVCVAALHHWGTAPVGQLTGEEEFSLRIFWMGRNKGSSSQVDIKPLEATRSYEMFSVGFVYVLNISLNLWS